MNRFQAATFSDFLNSANSCDKPVVLFGCGPLLQFCIDILAKHNIIPKCIVDNNFWFWGNCHCGLTIESPRLLNGNLQNAIVLIVSTHIFAIEKQLIEMGIEEYYALLCFADLYLYEESPFYAIIPLQEV
jgi:hypothetical protein